MSKVSVETDKIALSSSVHLQLGGLGIEVPIADYQAMLAAIDADLAELHRETVKRERAAMSRMKRAYEASRELRPILYEQEGDYFLLREKPDAAALEAYLDKYASLMGFE